jgi:pre-mRNA-splicing factor SPF27
MAEAPELLESLPYYDNDLEQFPWLKEKVDREFARQPKPPATLHPRVPPVYQLFAVRSLSKSF